MEEETVSRIVRSTCGLCAVGCGVRIRLEGGRVAQVEGDPENPLNRGALCPKGLASTDYLFHPDRLKHPLMREGNRGQGKWRQVPWDEALTVVATHLQRAKDLHGPESVAFVHGAAKGLQESYLCRLANVFGTPNVAWQGHVCFLPRVIASRMTYGFYAVPDYDANPSCIVIWGKNTEETLHHAHQRVLGALERGAKLIVIDPRQTDLAKASDIWLQLRPGTDLVLALGMLHVMIQEGLYDREFVDKCTVGFGRLKAHVQHYTLDKVEAITWVPAQKIREAARLYAQEKPGCIQWGNAIDHGVNSFQTARSICILRAVTGNLGVPGGEIQPLPLVLRGRRSPELERVDRMPDPVWEKRVGTDLRILPGIRYVQPQSIIKAILEEKPYAIRALYIQGANPILSYSHARRVREALEKVEFLAVADLFMTPTAALADVVLPAASYLEFDSVVTPPYSYPVTLAQQKVTRIRGCRSDYEILAGLAEKLELGEFFWDTEEQCLDAVLEPAGLSFHELKSVALIPGKRQYREDNAGGFQTPSGKVELVSGQLEAWGFEPLPPFHEPPETPQSDPDLAKEYPFILISWKVAPFRHSGGRQVVALRDCQPDPVVRVHPQTAEKAGITDGDWVWIETPRGQIRQRAHLTRELDPRVIGADYAWWFPEKGASNLFGWSQANINVLTDDNPPYNAEMGTTNLRGMLCRISRASVQDKPSSFNFGEQP